MSHPEAKVARMEIKDTSNTADTTLPARFVELQQMVAAMAPDFVKFYGNGNKAAGTRIRVAMQELKALCQTVRTEVQSMKGSTTGSSTSAEA
jgi:hypothetical protein